MLIGAGNLLIILEYKSDRVVLRDDLSSQLSKWEVIRNKKLNEMGIKVMKMSHDQDVEMVKQWMIVTVIRQHRGYNL